MANNRLYRNFVILQENERGYASSSEKTLSGYSKIESKGDKCKISFYAQNVKKDNDDYYMLLICCNKDEKQIINLGPVAVSDSGKVEVTKEYNTENIAGLGISFEKISGTAIAKLIQGTPIFVMCGFLNGQQPNDNWKEYKIVKAIETKYKGVSKQKERTIKKEDIKEIKREVKQTEVKQIEINKKETNINEEVNINCDIDKNDMDNRKIEYNKDVKLPNPYDNKENLRGKFDDYEDEIEANKEFDVINEKMKGSIGEYFESIAQGFERSYTSIDDLKYTKWYKIPVTNLQQMCDMSDYNKYTLAYYPMLNYYPYIKVYGEFMIGYKCDKSGDLKYIVYAIPGTKDKDDQPYDGRTGFVTWVKNKNNSKSGYWLMFYDFKNSTVVVPMQ